MVFRGLLYSCVVLGLVPVLSAAEPQQASIAPRTVTLVGQEIPLTQALEQLQKQTDYQVKDRRLDKEELKIRLDLQEASFWQALDAIARQANLNVSLFE